MTAPLRRFLGVDDSADARALLGLSHPTPAPTQIDAALRKQLARVHRHPDGSSAEGEAVRQRLREAAEQLRAEAVSARSNAPGPRQPAGAGRGHAPPADSRRTMRPRGGRSAFARRLTEFDRAVLAVLVGCGGWNAESRARLVALAGAYGVSVHGLMRVVTGLADYARRGGPPIAVSDIVSGAPRMTAPSSNRGDESLDATSELVTRLLPEFREDSIGARVKIAALFVLVFLISLIAFVRLLRPTPPQRIAESPTVVDDAPTDAPSPAEPGVETLPPANRPMTTRLATFANPPTFLGTGLPMEVTNAADESATLPQHFDEMARKLTVADDEPSEAVLRNWEVSVNTIATGWFLTDEATFNAVEQTMLECLYAASDYPSVSDALLDELVPPSGRLAEPTDVVRGAWKAGMLGRISSANLPPAVTQQARGLLDIALNRPDAQLDAQPESFDAAALMWLRCAMPSLVERTSYDDRAYDFWELWLSSVRQVVDPRGDDEQRAAYADAIMDALHALAAQPTDLTADSRATNVIGRLIDLADFQDSTVVRRRMLALFDDQAMSTQDLWIITSIAVQFKDGGARDWLVRELVVPPEADAPHRRRLADRWQSAWPEPVDMRRAAAAGAQGLSVDAALFQRWQQLLEALGQALEEPSETARMQRLVHISRLNEAAAAMLQQDVATAEPILDALAEALLAKTSSDAQQSPGRVSPQPRGRQRQPAQPRGRGGISRAQRPGQPIGVDGEWAALYEQAGRNVTEKLNLLTALRDSAGTDLGPIDAQVFVREVYRGTPQEVRELAQSILVDQFSRGPNVALQMLDQFIDAPSVASTSETIATLTGALLPSSNAPSWFREARLALVQHTLALQPAVSHRINELTNELTDSYISRLRRTSRNALPNILPETAQDAAGRLRDSWQHVASMLIASQPTPGELPVLARRHAVRQRLARGPVQQFVAAQVAVAELLAYVVTAEKPYLSEYVAALLNDAADERDSADSVLAQAVDAELAMAQLWRLRMGGSPEEGQ